MRLRKVPNLKFTNCIYLKFFHLIFQTRLMLWFYIWSSGVWDCLQGTPLHHLTLVASGAFAFNPTGLFACFKICCLSLWLPICPNLGSDWDSPTLEYWLVLVQPSTESEVTQSCLTVCNPMDYSLHYQAPLSMGFSRQGYWSGLAFPLRAIKNRLGFPGGSVVKKPPANTGNTGSISDPGRSHIPQSNKAWAP